MNATTTNSAIKAVVVMDMDLNGEGFHGFSIRIGGKTYEMGVDGADKTATDRSIADAEKVALVLSLLPSTPSWKQKGMHYEFEIDITPAIGRTIRQLSTSYKPDR